MMRTTMSALSACMMLMAVGLTLVVGVQPGTGAVANPVVPTGGVAYIFAAPFGWNRVQETTFGLGVWVHPGDTGYTQSISARADHFTGTLYELSQKMVSHIKSQHPDVKMGSIQSATVCAGHPATYLTYAATVKGVVLIYEQMLTIWGTTAYAATYTRASTEASIGAARHSLTTLCGGHAPGGVPPSAPPGVVTPTPTPSPLTNINTPQPMQTYGNPAATITPRLGP
jgi:hypothetical protein